MFRIKHSREVALKILYQWDVLGYIDDEINEIKKNSFEIFKGLRKDEKMFVENLVDEVVKNKSRIDKTIKENLIGWKLTRLNPIERNLMRMALVECINPKEKAVIIDDAVRIAKKYSDQDSYKIINAVLDKVL